MCFLYITVQSPESTSHVKRMCKYRPKKGCCLHFLPCCWSDWLVPPPPITHIHPRNSLHPIAIKYGRKYWKPTSSCKISAVIKFASCFHPNMPGERSRIFCFVKKTHTSCSDFYAKFTSSSQFSKKSEFLLLCHWHPNKQMSSKPKTLKTTTQRSHAAKQIEKKPESRASALNVFFNQAPKDEFSREGQTLLVYLVTYFKF